MNLEDLQNNILDIHKRFNGLPEPPIRLLARLELIQEALRITHEVKGLMTRCVADIRRYQVETLGFQKCSNAEAFRLLTGTIITEQNYDGAASFGPWSVNSITGKPWDIKVNTLRMRHTTFNTNQVPFERRTVHKIVSIGLGGLKKDTIPPDVLERLNFLHSKQLFDGYLAILPESMLESAEVKADPILCGVIGHTNLAGHVEWTSYFVDSWS